jgi:hypothetical protein
MATVSELHRTNAELVELVSQLSDRLAALEALGYHPEEEEKEERI